MLRLSPLQASFLRVHCAFLVCSNVARDCGKPEHAVRPGAPGDGFAAFDQALKMLGAFRPMAHGQIGHPIKHCRSHRSQGTLAMYGTCTDVGMPPFVWVCVCVGSMVYYGLWSAVCGVRV